jgi:hypothetical protein
MIKNRVLIAFRPYSRKIVNLQELTHALKKSGYEVVVTDFEKIPIRQQIIETMKSEYLIGTYGSNLVNAIFLTPQASVVVLWHKYAKYFWSRRYCVIHSAFLSMGVKLIEYDQPNYDKRNSYTEGIHVPAYFYRAGNRNILRREKINLDAMIHYPLPAMYEITSVDLYIEPHEVIQLLQNSKQ